MIGRLRIVRGYARLALHILIGVLIVALIFPFVHKLRHRRLIHWWSRKLLRICGITLRVQGQIPDISGSLLLMNHVSWLDIYALHSVRPVRFVAKSEIRRWPVIGFLCVHTGTLFIERGRRHAVHQANHAIADVLHAGDPVAIFPEGTTTDGTHLLPFHANLVQAALAAQAPVLPVALRYLDVEGQPTRAPAFVGEASLLDSLRDTLLGAPIVAELHFLPQLDTAGRTRHEVGTAARAAIARALQLAPPHEPAVSPAANPDGDAVDTEPETTLGPQDELL